MTEVTECHMNFMLWKKICPTYLHYSSIFLEVKLAIFVSPVVLCAGGTPSSVFARPPSCPVNGASNRLLDRISLQHPNSKSWHDIAIVEQNVGDDTLVVLVENGKGANVFFLKWGKGERYGCSMGCWWLEFIFGSDTFWVFLAWNLCWGIDTWRIVGIYCLLHGWSEDTNPVRWGYMIINYCWSGWELTLIWFGMWSLVNMFQVLCAARRIRGWIILD